MTIKRYIHDQVLKDSETKVILLTGPRQTGKTTLSKQLITPFTYLNYDKPADRLIIADQKWNRDTALLILDELHKMDEWKRLVKGVYDTEGLSPRIIVTGSAKLDIFRKVGDSLAGRYFKFRLHPFDIWEICNHTNLKLSPKEALEKLTQYGGFPEPFLTSSPTHHRRWKQTHLDIILRQDLLDLQAVQDIAKLETLIELLKHRVGSTISYENLARDLEKDGKTIKKWLQLLENLYIIFKVTPYSKNINMSLLKGPKYYFYDTSHIPDPGAQLENIVAAALLKQLHFIEDLQGYKTNLHFLRTKKGQEIDFLCTVDNTPTTMIEVKSQNDKLSKHFKHFQKFLPNISQIQLTKDLPTDHHYPNGAKVCNLAHWLAKMPIPLPNHT